MSDIGILAYGAYIPLRRLQRASIYAAHAWFAPELRGAAKGERAVACWDEDAITMAVEAGRDALTGIERSGIGGVSLASTTLPFADRSNAGVVKEALTLNDASGAIDVGGSQRAGTSALIQALRAASAGGAPQLCIASEMRKTPPASEAELSFGDAAAAFLVGSGKPIARFIGAYSVTIDFSTTTAPAGSISTTPGKAAGCARKATRRSARTGSRRRWSTSASGRTMSPIAPLPSPPGARRKPWPGKPASIRTG